MLSTTLIASLIYTLATVAAQTNDETNPREINPSIIESGRATHYGVSYQGQNMGCAGAGRYDTNNPYILAVSPALYASVPCGTYVTITGPAGSLTTPRTDSCPGCTRNLLDLSEAGSTIVCGRPSTCNVTFTILKGD